MKMSLITCLLVISCIAFVSFIKLSQIDKEVPYPENYRKWEHVKSMLINSKDPKSAHSRGYHHIYANNKAMEGYMTGKFPDGSVIVADFIEMVEKEGSVHEGKRKFIDVMVKDAEKYKTTGGWGYEEFDGDSRSLRVVTQVNAGTKCYNCHAPQAEKDFVFSKYRN